jgi:hypothetical protein
MVNRDRRLHEREGVDELVAELHTETERIRLGTVRDLSVSGLFVRTQVRLEEGARVLLFIGSARSSAALRVEARVVHSVPGMGFGAMFLDGNAETRRWIGLVLSELRDDDPEA